MVGIVVVCQALAVVAVKFIESLEVGVAFRAGISEAPLSERSGYVAGIL
jgi:hypothetical protein